MTQQVRHVRSTAFDEEDREREKEIARYTRENDPCIVFWELLDMHDGKLDEARTATIKQHLDSCSWCTATYRGSLQGRENAQKELENPRIPGPPLPGTFLYELNQTLDAMEAELKQPPKKADDAA